MKAATSVADAGLPFALAFGAPVDFVGRDADQRRRHLRQREIAAVALLAHVRGKGHGRGTVRDPALGIQLESQRGREALLLPAIGLARQDHRHNRPAGVAMLEEADFLVHVMAFRRRGRAEHHQSGGSVERGDGLIVQRTARAEIFAVAEDGAELPRNRAERGRAARQPAQREAFEARMQPFRQRGVGMAVGEEGAVFEINGVLTLALAEPNGSTIADETVCSISICPECRSSHALRRPGQAKREPGSLHDGGRAFGRIGRERPSAATNAECFAGRRVS